MFESGCVSGMEDKDHGGADNMQEEEPNSDTLSLSIEGKDIDDIFLFLPGSSMEDTPSRSVEAGGGSPLSGSEPPAALDSAVTQISRASDPPLESNVENGRNENKGIGKDTEQLKKRIRSEEPSDTHDLPGIGNPSSMGVPKRRKLLGTEKAASAELNTIEDTTEHDPFDILEEVSRPFNQEQGDSSLTPCPLYLFLGPTLGWCIGGMGDQ